MKSLFSNRFFQIGAISAICVVCYFGMRSMPAYNCTFLHASPPLHTEGAPNDEFCEVGNPGFIDLNRTRYAILSEVAATDQNDSFLLSLHTLSGRPLKFEEIAITHTKKIHLLIVDDTLGTYHHVHPEPTDTPGLFLFRFPFDPNKAYRMIAEFVPMRTQAQVVAETRFATTASKDAPPIQPTPISDVSQQTGNRLQSQKDGYLFELMLPLSGLQPQAENEVMLRISANGADVPLQEIMGTYAHLVAFDYTGRGFAHFHPILENNANPILTQPTRPSIPFSFQGLEPGGYRLWVQVMLDGKEYFIPFDLQVPASSLALSNIY